ncbi:putative membrane protein [Rhizobium sp. RAS22]|nr:putative membrane protein [Rhizobium sp. RAS22]
MKYRSPTAVAADEFRQRTAELIVVIAGPLIAALVIIQIYHGAVSGKGGDLTIQGDPFSYYLFSGILACIGMIALTVSAATTRQLF